MNTFSVAGITVYPFGLCVSAAALFALALALLFSRGEKAQREVSFLFLFGLPLGLLFARLGYCLATLDWVMQEGFLRVFFSTRGGYLCYGAAVGLALGAWCAGRVCRVSFARMADTAALPAALMLALCRLAEGLVGSGYGWSVEEWFMDYNGMSLVTLEDPSFFCRFPFAVGDMYGQWNWAVFMLEAIMALVILTVLVRTRRRTEREGALAIRFLLLYASSQILLESMRQDNVLRFGFVRINQILSALVLLALLVLCALLAGEKRPLPLTARTAVLFAGAGVVILMEFALEKRISAIEWMTMDICYAVMAIACCAMGAAVHGLWKRAFPSRV